ncbi:MAG: DUF3316 domain-containing protein [Prevotella sp.]|nr:DUF3316 domain-containing protein [Prevotella sp.]
MSSQLFLPAHAQQEPSSTRSYMLGIGSANILDTYLSAEKYQGSEVRYISTTTRPTRWNGIRQMMLHEGQFDIVSNRADNNDELGGMYRFQYHLRRHWDIAHGFSVEAGGGIGAQIGFLHNTRNSNNPAQAYAALQLLPSVAVAKSVQIFHRSVKFSYEASAPLLGLMFSPNYGQSYYEIFSRGNYDHNVVPTTIGSTPSLRHMLTADIPLSKRKPSTRLRIGYLGDYHQAEVNSLKYHQYAHMLILGLTITK